MAERSVRIEPSDRAQLMLVGAVAIALVIVGIVVVYNTVLYSDTQTATDTTNNARQAEAFSQQVEKEIGIIGRELAASSDLTEANLNDTVANWSQVQAFSHANTDPVFVEVEPGGCGGTCSPGDTYNATVIWQSETFTYRNGITAEIEVPTGDPTVYFVNSSGAILTIEGNRTPVETVAASANAGALGRSGTDVTGDGIEDVPYLTNDSTPVVRITNESGGSTTLATPGDGALTGPPRSTMTRLGTDVFPSSVLFVGNGNDTIFRAEPGGSVTEVLDPNNGARAVIGSFDVTGDFSADELVFVDDSNQVRYANNGSCSGDCTSLPNGGIGSNSAIGGIGAGPPLDNDSTVASSVVTVDGSNNIKLVGASSASGTGTTIITTPNAAKSPPTVADVDFDGDEEIVYLGKADSYLKYVDDVYGNNTVKFLLDEDGDKIEAEGLGGAA